MTIFNHPFEDVLFDMASGFVSFILFTVIFSPLIKKIFGNSLIRKRNDFIDWVCKFIPFTEEKRILNLESKLLRYYEASIDQERKIYFILQSFSNIVISFVVGFLLFIISIWALIGLDYVSTIYRMYGQQHGINEFKNPKIGPAVQFFCAAIGGVIFMIQAISSAFLCLQYNNASKSVFDIQNRLSKITGKSLEEIKLKNLNDHNKKSSNYDPTIL